jgi:hypothetical protein
MTVADRWNWWPSRPLTHAELAAEEEAPAAPPALPAK